MNVFFSSSLTSSSVAAAILTVVLALPAVSVAPLAAQPPTRETGEDFDLPSVQSAASAEAASSGEGPRTGVADADSEERVEGNEQGANEDGLVTEQATAKAVAERVARESAPRRSTEPRTLRFNFTGASWQDVLDWFAEQADLSLQIDRAPAGTVNFVDPNRQYTVDEGLDLLNRLLLDRGWALVRRGRMLLLIDLELENADKYISEMAELVTPEEFDSRGNSDIVKCIFPLGGMSPDTAREELAQLVGPWGRVIVLESARQVVVTETVGKLKTIRDLLETARSTESNVVEIQLQHRTAEEVLELARPLLGLELGENTSDEIRIAVSVYGDRIFATGMPGKLSLLESIVERADTPLPTADQETASEVALPILQSHPVTTADVATVFEVLQTLLAGTPDARIAVDPKTNAIIASARPETQKLITSTIAELEGSGTELEFIDLKRLDPSQALLTVNKFFGVTEAGGDGPTVDGDPVTGRLWIRGTQQEIEMVKKLLSELDGDDSLGALGDRVKVLPYSGRAADAALDQLEKLWPMTGLQNRIRVYTPAREGRSEGGLPERRIIRDSEVSRRQSERDSTRPATSRQPEASHRRPSDYWFVSQQSDDPQQVEDPFDAIDAAETPLNPAGQGQRGPDQTDQNTVEQQRRLRRPESVEDANAGADIVVQVTPSGLVIASQDAKALQTFESLLQSVAAPSGLQSSLPTIYWLKYIKAEVAAELVSSVLGGAESGGSSLTDSVIGGLGGGMLGGLLGMGGGGGEEAPTAKSVLTSTGSVSIVPDARLNALIVQANPADLHFIDLILEKIDVQESPEDVETIAQPRLIPVIYQDAADVANLVKAVFADKIAGQQEGGGGDDRRGQPSPRDIMEAFRGGRGGGGRGGNDDGGGGSSSKSEPTKMTVAVDARSNSLVITAAPQDFDAVRQLVETLDQQGMGSEEDVVVIPLPGTMQPGVMQQALESVLGAKVSTTSTSTSPSSSSDSGRGSSRSDADSNGDGPSAEDIQRRIEFFRSRFGGGGDRGGSRGGDAGGSRGSFGGGRGGSRSGDSDGGRGGAPDRSRGGDRGRGGPPGGGGRF